jgi:hypothetical protein
MYFEIPFTDASGRWAINNTMRKGSRTNLQNWLVRSAHDIDYAENDTISEKNKGHQRDSSLVDHAGSSDDTNSHACKNGETSAVVVVACENSAPDDSRKSGNSRNNSLTGAAGTADDVIGSSGVVNIPVYHHPVDHQVHAASVSTHSNISAGYQSEKNNNLSSLKQFNNFMLHAYNTAKSQSGGGTSVSSRESHTERCTSRDMNSSFNTSAKSQDNSDRLFRAAPQRMSSVPELRSNSHPVADAPAGHDNTMKVDECEGSEIRIHTAMNINSSSWQIARVNSSIGSSSPRRPLTVLRQTSRT